MKGDVAVFFLCTEVSLYVVPSILRNGRGNTLPFPLPACMDIYLSVLS
jgi:hypothetical protein